MDFDKNIFISRDQGFLSGVDEVGRGPLAGPVVAACVLISNISNDVLEILSELGVADSKKLTHKKRNLILEKLGITQLQINKKFKIKILNEEIEYSINEVSERKIEEINILEASLLAMKNSYNILGKDYDHDGILLIDGNKTPKNLPEELEAITVVKGDSKSLIIGLASIIAKVYRDNLMENMGREFPGYGLEKHAGYPTKAHMEAIKELGPTIHHRKTFKGVKEYLND